MVHSKSKGKYTSARRGGQWSNHVNVVYPEAPDPEDDDNLYVIDADTESSKSNHKREIYCTVEINGKDVELKIDTAAKCNVITVDLFKKISGVEKVDQSIAVQLLMVET